MKPKYISVKILANGAVVYFAEETVGSGTMQSELMTLTPTAATVLATRVIEWWLHETQAHPASLALLGSTYGAGNVKEAEDAVRRLLARGADDGKGHVAPRSGGARERDASAGGKVRKRERVRRVLRQVEPARRSARARARR